MPALRERLAVVEAEAKANDPKALRAELARLKAEHKPAVDPAAIEAADRAGYARGYAEGMAALAKSLDAIEVQIRECRVGLAAHRPALAPVHRPVSSLAPKTPSCVKPIARSGNVSNPERRIIAALAFWSSVGRDSPTRPMVAAVAGYSPSSGGFGNLVGAMRTAGLVDIPVAGCIALTDGGRALTNGVMPPAEARDFVLGVLSVPQRGLVEAAIGAGEISRDDLAQRTDYSPTSGGFGNLVGSLCSLGIFMKPRAGSIALSDWAASVL